MKCVATRTLLVVILIIGTCSGHKAKNSRGSRKGKDNGSGVGNLAGMSRCLLSRTFPCFAPGLQMRCFSQQQACDGIRHCPWGDDEYNCDTKIRPSSTRFITRTFTQTTTTTSATVTSAITSVSFSTTTTATSTVTRSLAAVVNFLGLASTVTTVVTSLLTASVLTPIGAGNGLAAGVFYCDNLNPLNGAVPAIPGAVSVDLAVPSATIVNAASIICTPASTIFLLM